MFADRHDAGRRLADVLQARTDIADAIVLGVPRGGVVVAAEVARELGLPLDIVIVSKLGAPGQPEYAVGAVDADGDVTVVDGLPLPESYIDREGTARSAEVRRRIAAFRGYRPAPDVAGRTIIVVDDGIATGLTIRKAVEYLRRHRARRVIVATPVAPRRTAERMRAEGIDVVCVEEPHDFAAVGQFYRRFDQTLDAEVLALLDAARSRGSSPR